MTNSLTEIPRVGVKVRYLGGDDYVHVTKGNVYQINAMAGSFTSCFENDEGRYSAITERTCSQFELVAEESEPQPDVHALLANLGRRIHEVETALAPKSFEERCLAELEAHEASLEKADDAVNPAHYKRGKYETIDVIEHITAGYDDPFVAYCVGNAVKYADRAPYKHDSPAECLRKAAWYLTRAAEHVEAGESE